jgi:plasmid stabilization system protein ParE
MSYAFHPASLAELHSAVAYYDCQKDNLGQELLAEVRVVIHRAMDNPKQFPRLDGRVRRGRVSRFPYGLVYVVRPGEIYIFAVMHLHRDPEYWKDRL